MVGSEHVINHGSAPHVFRPYLFDSSVYEHFWAEDKVGRKGKHYKKSN